MDICHVGGLAHFFKEVPFPSLGYVPAQMKNQNDPQSPASLTRHNDNVLDAGSDRFLDDVLYGRLVHNGEASLSASLSWLAGTAYQVQRRV